MDASIRYWLLSRQGDVQVAESVRKGFNLPGLDMESITEWSCRLAGKYYKLKRGDQFFSTDCVELYLI